ncbi:MAG: ABC transporter ATP-binding protein [Candidatus Eisenbacteria bacterium]|uniref:ABC transporter ATP-binding protein n=1 Tax=Eiseniibacteriota bacterium TaxID=2212470 RepID=A0A538SAH0_UNCEI|nr:MAG: ABC transporter ATP-binding protein [Candidatus Eisenbacteria bacterium]
MDPVRESLTVLLLEVDGVSKSFGGIRAVDKCTLEVEAGSIVGLIGPNGAGKSTLFNLVIGTYSPDVGRIVFRDERIDGMPPYEIVERGLAKTFQIPREFRSLTVLENVMVSARGEPGESPVLSLLGLRRVWRREEELERKSRDLLALIGLSELADEPARNLSGGQKKLLELARVLVMDPSLILLDEPVAGVNPTLSLKILSLIEDLRKSGKTFFLIEHDMNVVFNRCDRVIVMHQGRVIAEGKPAEVRAHPAVLESYLGG